MKSINFGENLEEFCINNDPSRVVKFSPYDYSIITRLNEVRKAATEEVEKIKRDDGVDDLDMAGNYIEKLNDFLKEKIDYIFGYPVADIVFGNQSPAAVGKDGVMLFSRFLDAAVPVIESAIEKGQKESVKKIAKYTERYHK